MCRMIKTIIFDLGAVYFKIDWLKIDEDMREKYGISTLIRSSYGEEINELYNKTQIGDGKMLDVFTKICEGKEINSQEVADYYRELYTKYKKINERMNELIKKLKEKYKVVCFTDTNEIHFQSHKEQNQLEIFDGEFVSFNIGKIKREEGAFEEVIKDLGCMPNEIVFIDDHEKNIANAKNVGINAIKYEDDDQLIKDFKEMGVNI